MDACRKETVSLRRWLIETALPLWSSAGFDRDRARFHERLDFRGRPVDAVPHRAMVQARQIYVFSHAAILGWFPEGAALAEIAMASLIADYRDRPSGIGGFAFSVDAHKQVVSPVRDAYAHAFILFAIAWAYRLNGDTKLLEIADETIGFIDASLTDPLHGGVFDAYPVLSRAKRQNPHMHLLEAYLALEVSAPGRGYLDRARGLVRLFHERMFHPELGVLPEYFAEDWSEHPDEAMRNLFEPGHHFEWLWLLAEYEALTGDRIAHGASRMDQTARRVGLAASGLVFDELGADFNVRKSSHRLWTHAEAAKAGVVRQLRGDPDAPAFAASMVRGLFENFLDRPFAGGWIDHIGPDRQSLVDYAPASSLYHLFLAASELDRVFAQPPAAPQPAPVRRRAHVAGGAN